MSKQMMPKKTLRLRKRAEFLAVREGEKRRGPLFMLEVKPRSAETSLAAKIGETPRVGITVTKKNGNAVIRNRIRRRLKEVVRCHTAGDMAASTDYVIVARKEVLNTPFLKLARELAQRVTRKADKSSADKNRRNDRPESGPVNGKKS